MFNHGSTIRKSKEVNGTFSLEAFLASKKSSSNCRPQGRRNDCRCGWAWSQGSKISLEFCLSMLTTESISKLLEYERMGHGPVVLPSSAAKRKKLNNTILCNKEGAMPLVSPFLTPLVQNPIFQTVDLGSASLNCLGTSR